MGFSLIPQNTRDLWKEWDLRLLVLLSLFIQLTLAIQGIRRKSIFKNWIRVVVWTTYLADSIATLTLSVLSNRLANIKETKGMIDPKSQIIAFWAPFLLLHLGGTDAVTAYIVEDNELWPRQLAQLFVQVGLVCYIYSMALLGSSTLSILAVGMILVGFIKYAERTLCLYWASKGPLRDSMLCSSNADPVLPTAVELLAPTKNRSVNSGEAPKRDINLVKAYELFKVFKRPFAGLAVNFVDQKVSRKMFMDPGLDSEDAFEIVEIELGIMYDLLYTKAPLLNCRWGIIRWVINLSVLCSVLIFFSLQDNKDYVKVDICITLLLISAAILLEIYSLLVAIQSDWIYHWQPQRLESSPISSAISLLRSCPSPRWSNTVAQVNFLRSSIRKRNSIFRHPRFAKLHEMVEKNYIGHKEFKHNIKGLIFRHMREMIGHLDKTLALKSHLASFKLETHELLKRSNCGPLTWSVQKEFDQSILIWHIATELRYYEDGGRMQDEDIMNSKMSMLVSRYMFYLLAFYPSMLPTGIGLVLYEDTMVEAQNFFDAELVMLPKKEGSISLAVIKWAQKLFKKEAHIHTRLCSCSEEHKSRESRDMCELCYLLLQVRAGLSSWKIRRAKRKSVLFDACHLAWQLKSVDTWDIISKVWVRMLICAAFQSKDYKHCESLKRGGELLSHVWLLMAHLGIAQPE